MLISVRNEVLAGILLDILVLSMPIKLSNYIYLQYSVYFDDLYINLLYNLIKQPIRISEALI